MSKRISYLRGTRNEEAPLMCAAWAAGKVGSSAYVLFGRGDGGKENEVVTGLAVTQYEFDDHELSDTIYALGTEEGPPLRMAVHPGGDGIICSFLNNCRLFEMQNADKSKVEASKRELLLLQGIGAQNCLMFSGDGSLFAAGGKDGHLRVFQWPSLHVVLDEPQAHRCIQDLDFSLDSAFLASTAEDGACRVWDLSKVAPVTALSHEKDEKFGYCRFSRDPTKPFLFVTVAKGRRGLIGVWDMSDWSKVGFKFFEEHPLSAFAISRDGKFLAIGSTEGDISVVDVKSMTVRHRVGNAHVTSVTALEFSRNRKALLSTGADSSARVSALNKGEWKEWQLYTLLAAMILLSAFLFTDFSYQ